MKFERVQQLRRRVVENYIPDLRDNLPTPEAPNSAVEKLEAPEDAWPLIERLFPSELREKLFALVADLPEGESRARVAVGKVEDGSRHPHDFIIDKTADGIRMYFVDPEHQMGRSKSKSVLPRKGNLRPKISTLITLAMRDAQSVPEMSVIRFRAAAIEDPRLLKMAPQFEMAKELLESGDVPALLKGKENEITFRLNIRPDETLVQSRYSNGPELQQFLHGERSSNALEGKAHSHELIMSHFVKHAEAGRFVPLNQAAETAPEQQQAFSEAA